jgi:orotate phosphoribosyltransferase
MNETSHEKTNDDGLRDLLRRELLEHALKFGDFTLASGRKSRYYINCKPVTLDAKGAYLSASALFRLVPRDCAAVGGLTLGADPLVSGITVISHLEKRPVRGFLVRKEAKGHGTRNRIENCPPEGSRVVIVDDVITTGGSALKAAEAALAANLEVVRAVSLVDREQGGAEAFSRLGIAMESVFRIQELLDAQ